MNHSIIRCVRWFLLCASLFFLISCTVAPPKNIENVCGIFEQYPQWKKQSHQAQVRWNIPIATQMAIIHQESKFRAKARPPRKTLLWVIPWERPSSAYGYSQALDSTWALYKKNLPYSLWTSRTVFADSVDFIGWYAYQAKKRANIPPDDPYRLYLAYHEGIGGYLRKSYLAKPWLILVARKVKARAMLYQIQLEQCMRY